MALEVLFADLVSAEDDGGQDDDGQVQVAQDFVAGGNKRHDAYLGSDGAGDEHDADKESVAQRALLALLGLVVLAEPGHAREGKADDGAQHSDEHDDDVDDGDTLVAQALEQRVEGQGFGGDVVDVGVAEEHGAEDYEQDGIGEEAGDGGLLALAAAGEVVRDGGDIGNNGGLEAARLWRSR